MIGESYTFNNETIIKKRKRVGFDLFSLASKISFFLLFDWFLGGYNAGSDFGRLFYLLVYACFIRTFFSNL